MKNEKYRFRCIPNPNVIYKPEYLYDVEAMRQHPEYEEIDENGQVVTKSEVDLVKRIPLVTTPPPKAPKKKKG